MQGQTVGPAGVRAFVVLGVLQIFLDEGLQPDSGAALQDGHVLEEAVPLKAVEGSLGLGLVPGAQGDLLATAQLDLVDAVPGKKVHAGIHSPILLLASR